MLTCRQIIRKTEKARRAPGSLPPSSGNLVLVMMPVMVLVMVPMQPHGIGRSSHAAKQQHRNSGK